jgi:RNA polymerase sigma factor (sigma-70 family)
MPRSKDDAGDSKYTFVDEQARRNHAKLVRQLCKSLGVDPEEARDIAQDTYIDLLRSRVQFQNVRRPFSYVMKAAGRVAARYRKKRSAEEAKLTIDSEVVEDRGEKPELLDGQPILDALVVQESWQRTYAGLTPEQKQVLDLKAEGMSIQEIAVKAGFTPDQVERRLTDAYDHMETLHHELVQGKVRK